MATIISNNRAALIDPIGTRVVSITFASSRRPVH